MEDVKGRRSAGFAISTYDEYMLSINAKERAEVDAGVNNNFRRLARAHDFIDSDFEITETGWAQLSRDIAQLERNALVWLRKSFLDARDEGHGEHGDLIGTFWWNPRSRKQRDLIVLGQSERIDMIDPSYGDLSETVWKGVSEFGQEVLGGQINFFDTGLES